MPSKLSIETTPKKTHTHIIYFKKRNHIDTGWVIFFMLYKIASFIVLNFSPLGVFVSTSLFSSLVVCWVFFNEEFCFYFHIMKVACSFDLDERSVCMFVFPLYVRVYGASSNLYTSTEKNLIHFHKMALTCMKQRGQKQSNNTLYVKSVKEIEGDSSRKSQHIKSNVVGCD